MKSGSSSSPSEWDRGVAAGETPPVKRARWLVWAMRFVLPHVWYVAPPGVVVVYAPPSACLGVMQTAAQPSVQRLHLTNIFDAGRRYFIEPERGGFRMTTTHKVFWHYRKRTKHTAILSGRFTPVNDEITEIEIDIRIRTFYLIQAFLMPLFMTSILVYVPWHPLIVAAAIIALFALSWFGHRYNAMSEAHAMLWFMHRALESFSAAQTLALPAESGAVAYARRDFEEAWEKFYRRQQAD